VAHRVVIADIEIEVDETVAVFKKVFALFVERGI